MKIKHYLPMLIVSTLVSGQALAASANSAKAQGPTDNEITKIVETVNDGEIKLAKYAIKTSQNPEVKKFAEHMITDHSQNNKKTEALGVTPLENSKSLALKTESQTSMDKLMSLKGKEFDQAYIADQLKTHEKVLNDLNSTLIPHAKNKELKAHLEMTSKKVESHLEHAKALNKTL